MTSRVNTKFVAVLGAVLLALCAGVAYVGMVMLRKSPEQLAKLGDEQASAGQWEDAADFYSRAVNKDPNDPRWLRLWIGALEHIVPVTAQQCQDSYFRDYLGALRALVEADRGNPEPAEQLLEEIYRRVSRYSPSLRSWEDLVGITEEFLRPYEAAPDRAVGIARYRGLARVGIAGVGTELTREVLDQTVADLTAALERDPADAAAAIGLADLHRMRAARLRQAREDEAADEAMERSSAVLADLVGHAPGNVQARFEFLRMTMARSMLKATAPASFVDLARRHAAEVDAVLHAAKNAAPGQTPVPVLGAVVSMMRALPEEGHGAALALIDRELAGQPASAPLMLLRADELNSAGKTPEALAQLQAVADLPNRPLSLEALVLFDLRNKAAAQQVDYALARWKQDLPAAEKEAVMAEARRYRDALATRIGAERPELMLVDAKLRYAAGDYDGARTLLSRYNETRGESDHAALVLLGDVMTRQGNAGAARRHYEQAAALRPGDARVLLALAGAHVAVRDYAEAASVLRRVLELEPGNAAAAEQLKTIAQLEKGSDADDPVLRLLQQLEKTTAGINPDYPAAIAALRRSIAEHGQDPRLTRPLVQLLITTGETDAAKESLRDALAASPDNASLLRLKEMLDAPSPVAYLLEEIDKSTAAPFSKHLSRREVYLRTGDAEKGAAELEAARKLEPDSPRIMEIDFVAALAEKKLDLAKAIAEKAAAANADNVSGLTFRARVALVENRAADAASFLQQAADADPLNPGIWRTLGDTRLAMQQSDRAGVAYRKALDIRPDDPGATKGLIRALFGQGRTAEALATARRAAPVAGRDPEFVELWIALESSATGGDRARAIELRRALVAKKPSDRRGRFSLAQLLIADRQFDEARTLIDALRKEADDVGLVELDASWYAAKGDFAGATTVFGNYIEALPEADRTDLPYILLARILSSNGHADKALRVLDEARKHQDPKTLNADRELADLYNRAGQTEKALEIVQRMLDAGVADEGDRLRRGAIDCLIRLGRAEQAEAMIAAMGDKADTAADLVLLRATAAEGRGDRARAREFYDRAIALDAENPRGYFARAAFLAADPLLAQDAEADLKQVIRLQPASTDARQALSQLYARLGRIDDALAQLRDAVAASPDDDNLRRGFINALLSSGRPASEAVDQLNEAIRRNPDSLTWLLASAEIHAVAGSPDQALPHLEKAWSLSKTPRVAIGYITALATARPPRTDKAFEVLATPELRTESSMELLMARALVRNVAGNQQRAALADLEAAYRLLDQGEPGQVGNFLSGVSSLVPPLPERLRVLDGLRAITPFTKWLLLNYALMVSQLPDPVPDALLESVRSLADQDDDARLAMAAMQLSGQLERNAGHFEASAAAFKRLMDINPEDPNSTNNYAYVLGVDLGRAADALPLAEKAVRLAPNNAIALHTLGAIQLGLGRVDDAAATLARSEELAKQPVEKAPLYVTMARLKLAQKDLGACTRYLQMLDAVLDTNPDLGRLHGKAAAEIRKSMETH